MNGNHRIQKNQEDVNDFKCVEDEIKQSFNVVNREGKEKKRMCIFTRHLNAKKSERPHLLDTTKPPIHRHSVDPMPETNKKPKR